MKIKKLTTIESKYFSAELMDGKLSRLSFQRDCPTASLCFNSKETLELWDELTELQEGLADGRFGR